MIKKLLLPLVLMSSCAQEQSQRLVIGSVGESSGIYVFDFDETKHRFISKTDVKNPTFMAFDRESSQIYSVSEMGPENSAVVIFDFDANAGSLTQISSELTQGGAPCHIAKFGELVATANYVGGNLSLFDASGERLDVVEFNAEGETLPSHLHCIIPSPDERYMFATDLGKDSVFRFEVTRRGVKQLYPAISVAKGSGPRHMTFNPAGDKAYLINELSGSVVGFDYDNGNLEAFQSIASDSVGGGGSADIHISADGAFLYASNRLKEDGISIFEVEPSSGKLTKIGYVNTGIHPRNFTLSPDGSLLLVACRDSDAVQIYSRNQATGMLEYLGEQYDIKVDSPMFVHFW